MTEIAIFGVGSVLFLVTTWATIAFGLVRIHELQGVDLDDSDQINRVETDGMLELHLTEPVVEPASEKG